VLVSCVYGYEEMYVSIVCARTLTEKKQNRKIRRWELVPHELFLPRACSTDANHSLLRTPAPSPPAPPPCSYSPIASSSLSSTSELFLAVEGKRPTMALVEFLQSQRFSASTR
jgi:hypothetical protein